MILNFVCINELGSETKAIGDKSVQKHPIYMLENNMFSLQKQNQNRFLKYFQSLITLNPKDRLSSVYEMKTSTKLMANINFVSLMQKKIPPPFVPNQVLYFGLVLNFNLQF